MANIAPVWHGQVAEGESGKDAPVPRLELHAMRQEFPIARSRCYLNNASIAPL